MFGFLSIVLFSFVSRTFAAPNGHAIHCGQSSNCETIISNDAIHHVFKRGQGIGSPDYVARFTAHEARGDPVKTYVTLGKTKIGWGCGT